MTDPVQDAIDAAILETVAGPKSVAVDGENVVSQSLLELDKLKNSAAANAAVRTDATFGLRFGRLVPPGACN